MTPVEWLDHPPTRPMVELDPDLRREQGVLEAALLVEDTAVFDEYAAWLRSLLTARGVPADVLQASFEAQSEALGPDMVEARAMLTNALAA